MNVNLNAQESKSIALMTINETQKLNLKQKIENFIKRVIDIVAGMCGLLLMFPVTICICIAKLFVKDKGPIFYKQTRIGKYGKTFEMYKYRTMVVGADDILKKYLMENEEARREFEKNHKLRNDPRITKLGKFLRKTSIDEIPQFINVLKGDMSLIGPRPIVNDEVSKFGNKITIVHSVRPGITGYWAANGRSDTSYEQRVKMETFYAQNYSLKLDVKIFLKTVESVLKKEGAV